MNTQKGFAPILLILLGLIVIGGGVYFYTNSYKKPESVNSENKLEIATTTAEKTNTIVDKENKIKSSNLKETRYSFRISPTNPAIVHPVTKAIFSKKINITQEDLGSTGKIVSKDSDSVVIELYGHGCLVPDGYPSVFVYVSKNLTDIYGFVFGHDEKEDVATQVQNIESYVELTKNKSEVTKVVIQTPPGDIIKDGYYYVNLNGWDKNKKELTVDFLSLKENYNDEALDVLFQHIEHNAGHTLNISTENVNKRNRVIPVSASEFRYDEGAMIYTSEEISEYFNNFSEEYRKNRGDLYPDALIEIYKGEIIRFYQVNTAC